MSKKSQEIKTKSQQKTLIQIFEEQYKEESNLQTALQNQHYYTEEEAKEDIFALVKNTMRERLTQKRQELKVFELGEHDYNLLNNMFKKLLEELNQT